MISISTFREFVEYFKEKFKNLTGQNDELRSIVTNVIEKANRIERESEVHEALEEESIAEAPTEAALSLQLLPGDESDPQELSEPPPQPKVKRRRTRVRHKINQQVCTL